MRRYGKSQVKLVVQSEKIDQEQAGVRSLSALYTGNQENKASNVTVFRFFLSTERCRWLVAIQNSKYNVSTPEANFASLPLCSKQFSDDAYEQDIQSEIMRTENQRILEDTTVANVFPCTGSGAVPKYKGVFGKRKRQNKRAEVCRLA